MPGKGLRLARAVLASKDAETGLHYNRHRFYDPASGRFISTDPIGLAGGLNLHQYAPNPIQWVDPLGLACYADLMAKVKQGELDFSTNRDAAVFWSGPNMKTAQQWAQRSGKATLEQTAGGKYLDALNLFGKDSGMTGKQAAEIWDAASAKYAEGASGNVNVFGTGAKKMNDFGSVRTWWRIEKPALIDNPNVTSVTRLKKDGTPAKTGHVNKCR